MQTMRKKVALTLALGLLLLVPTSIAMADNIAYGQVLNWGPLQGEANPFAYRNVQDYEATSFSRTGDNGVTVGVYNNEGDWCVGGPQNWLRRSVGWNYINTPTYNNEISADAGWVTALNCGSGHKYLIQGLHSYSVGGATQYSGATNVGSDY